MARRHRARARAARSRRRPRSPTARSRRRTLAASATRRSNRCAPRRRSGCARDGARRRARQHRAPVRERLSRHLRDGRSRRVREALSAEPDRASPRSTCSSRFSPAGPTRTLCASTGVPVAQSVTRGTRTACAMAQCARSRLSAPPHERRRLDYGMGRRTEARGHQPRHQRGPDGGDALRRRLHSYEPCSRRRAISADAPRIGTEPVS